MNTILFTLLAIPALTGSCAGDTEKRQVVELRKLANEVTLYPGFEKQNEWTVLKHGMASLHTVYKSEAQFSDIMKFYDQVLAEKGWGPPQRSPNGNWVFYPLGDYQIAIAQDANRRDNIDIEFSWDPD